MADVGESTLSLIGGGSGASGSTGACLILLLECDRPMGDPVRIALENRDRVLIGRDATRSCVRFSEGEVRRIVVRVADRRMSASHAQLERGPAGWMVQDAGSKNGVVLNGERSRGAVLRHGDLIELGHTLFLFCEAPAFRSETEFKIEAAGLQPPAPGLATFVPGLAAQLENLPRIAKSTVSVVVNGESGTGKELIARAVHALSGRPGPFIAVNCGALPTNLVETELFGYRKGAFSGANDDRPGLVRSADRGTLFLDEIGDLPLSSQPALLRVLQEREVVPVGSTRAVPVDIRLVAATHRNLEMLVNGDQFRADLFARISGAIIRLPPLRERREDMGLFIQSLLRRVAPDRCEQMTIAVEAARAMVRYHWPYNVRELEKAIGAAAVLAGSGRIELAHLPESVRAAAKPGFVAEDRVVPPELPPDQALRRDELVELLRQHDGNVSAVARAMGKARMQIQRWMKRYRLRPIDFKR